MRFRIKNPALRNGLIFGVILTLVVIVFTLVSPYLLQLLGQVTSYIGLAILIILVVLAGQRASKLTGKISTGALAAFIAGIFSSLLTSILFFVLVYVNINYYVQQAQLYANTQKPILHVTPDLVIQSELQQAVVSLICYAVLALIGGLAGAYMGSRRARLSPPVEYEESANVVPSS